MDCSLPGFSVHGIFQARVLEWGAIGFSPDKAKNFNYSKSDSVCRQRLGSTKGNQKRPPAPSDPMDCSLPGSSVHGIFQARVLEWGAIAFSNIYVLVYCIGVFLSESHVSCPQKVDNNYFIDVSED